MMASPRPSDPIPPISDDATKPVAPAASGSAGSMTTLGTSNFIVGFDWVLSLGVLALAFLIVSFSVRNADFWQHLAGGRLLLDGGYSFGKDPFNQVSPDRNWVNHAWLFDLVSYAIFKSIGGPGLVVVKGLLVMAMAGVLLLARRPNQPIWGGVICVTLALLAAAPRLMLQPALMGYFCLALLLFLLIRAPQFLRGPKLAMAVAAVFWLWANTDQWFFVGPLLLLLYTVGLIIRPDESNYPGRVKDLWISLAVGVIVCTINPHHIRVWSLPPELVDGTLAELFAGDGEYGPMFRTAFSKGALDFSGERDNPVNTYSMVVLLFMALVGFLGSLSSFSVPLFVVWAGFVGLSVYHLRATPLLVFVAAPIAATQITDLVKRLLSRPMADGSIRLLATGRLMSRVIMGITGVILLAASYPGWLHPFSLQRRWKWDLEPSQSMVLASENLQKLRTEGKLPADAKLLNLQPDFACYLAWYAPAEKPFFDYRIGLHAAEAADYAAIRKHLAPRDPKEKSSFDLIEFLNRYGITHAVTAHGNRGWNQTILSGLWQDADPFKTPEFVIWNVHGRAVTLGRTRQSIIPPDQLEALRFDPVKAAFTQLPTPAKPSLEPPLVDRELADRFVASTPVTPAEAEECFVLMRYRMALQNQFIARHSVAVMAQRFMLSKLGELVGNQHPYLRMLDSIVSNYPPNVPANVTATGILAVRAARRAIVASPNHPDGYAFLSMAYPEGNVTSSTELAQLVANSNLARALRRVPVDLTQRRSTMPLDELAVNLRQYHLNTRPQRLDMAYFAQQLAVASMKQELQEAENSAVFQGVEGQQVIDERHRQLDKLEKELSQLEKAMQTQMEKFTTESMRYNEPIEKASIARREGLANEALQELNKANERFQKKLNDLAANPGAAKPTEAEYGAHLAIVGDLVELKLYAGQTEEALAILGTLEGEQSNLSSLSGPVMEAYFKGRMAAARLLNPQNPQPQPYDQDPASRIRVLQLVAGLVAGDYERVVQSQEEETRKARSNLAKFVDSVYPNGLPKDLQSPAMIPPDLLVRLATNTNPVVSLIGWQSREMHTRMLNNYRYLVDAQADQHLQLGLTRLEMGDIKGARSQFKEVLKGPALPGRSPARNLSTEMLKLLGE